MSGKQDGPILIIEAPQLKIYIFTSWSIYEEPFFIIFYGVLVSPCDEMFMSLYFGTTGL